MPTFFQRTRDLTNQKCTAKLNLNEWCMKFDIDIDRTVFELVKEDFGLENETYEWYKARVQDHARLKKQHVIADQN